MMSLWDALRMNMMISYQELVRTFPKGKTVSIDDNLNRFRVWAFFNRLRGVHSHCQHQRTHQ